jgi:hypothetical protein
MAVAEPRTVRARVIIRASELTSALFDTTIAAIQTEGTRALCQRSVERYPYLDWTPLPPGSGVGADTLPLLTLEIIAENSGKARPDILGRFFYCIGREHDIQIGRLRDAEVLFRGDESAARTGPMLKRRLLDHVSRAIGRDVPEMGVMHDVFIPHIVIAENIVVGESSSANPLILPVRASALKAKQDSRLLAMFCTVVQGDTVESCTLRLSPVGKAQGGLQSCNVLETECGATVNRENWLDAVRGRLWQPPQCVIRVYMESYVFDRFGAFNGLDTR